MIIVFVTAHKQSSRRLCFNTCLSVILFTGGEYLGRYTPWAGTPLPPSRYTPGQVHPHPQQVHSCPPAGTPPWAGTSPPGKVHPQQIHPPGQVQPPGAVHAGRYGQQAGGTHPTGMHSSFVFFGNDNPCQLTTCVTVFPVDFQ